MDFTQYINPGLLVLVPVLYLIGAGIKSLGSIDNRKIPVLLGLVGIILSLFWVLASGVANTWLGAFTAIVQGVLCAGAAVYVNQIVKQYTE